MINTILCDSFLRLFNLLSDLKIILLLLRTQYIGLTIFYIGQDLCIKGGMKKNIVFDVYTKLTSKFLLSYWM